TRKAHLVGLIERAMEGDNLRRLYEQLDELQQQAVSEAVWDKEGYFRADRFKAKYGGTPVFATKRDERPFSDYWGSPTRLCLFLWNNDRYNYPWQGWIVPRDLQQGELVKRGHLTRPSFGVSRTFGASRVPGSLPMAEVPRCPQAQSLALGMCQLLPQA